MDEQRFDSLTRSLAGRRSRRALGRGVLGGGLGLALSRLWAGPASARRGRSGPGDPCRHDDQCWAADTSLVCAWNGFGNDGDYNCCAYDGSRCGGDRDCCGYGSCNGGFCAGGNFSASAGNGGVATANANGGTISIGDINSGGNSGNFIDVGNSSGNVSVDGGYVSNDTSISASAEGGVAIADASGGSGNVAGDGGSWSYDGQCFGSGCSCWQGPYADNPCNGSLVCCRQGGDNNGVCLSWSACNGSWGPGERCPGYCDWGQGCSSCTTGYCNWSGYCDWN